MHAVPKPTQVGGYKDTKARGSILVNDLGNIAPYFREKGFFRVVFGCAVKWPMRLFNKNIALCELVKRRYRV